MGVFFVYILKASVCLALFYLCYRVGLSKETFHRFNRITLLSLMVFSFLLPLVEVTVKDVPEVAQPFLSLEESMQVVVMDSGHDSDETSVHFPWKALMLQVYVSGILFFLLRYGWSLGRMSCLLRTCRKEEWEGGITLYVHRKKVAPFSWMKMMVISEEDLAKNGMAILAHERAHIRSGHSWDLLLMQVCILLQWFNPAVWLLKQELQTVHEYEADKWVVGQGIDAKAYQLSIIESVVGTRLFTMANNFNHTLLNKRIRMMNKARSNRWAYMKCLFVLPMAALAVVAFARPEVSIELEELKMKYSFLNEELPAKFGMNKKWPYTSSLIDNIPDDSIKQHNKPDSIMEEFKKTGVFDAKRLASGSSTGTPLIIIDDEVKGTDPEIMKKMDQTTIRSMLIFKNTHETAKIYGDKAKDGVIKITTWDYILKNE